MDKHLRDLLHVLDNLDVLMRRGTVRERVQSLAQAHLALQTLGKNAVPAHYGASARDRILAYLRHHVGEVIDGTELAVVAGISEYGRRVRELRTEMGWPIISGVGATGTRVGLFEAAELPHAIERMRPDQYCLLDDVRDVAAAQRWKVANKIRRHEEGTREKLLTYLRLNVGARLTVEELRYVAGDTTEWARRVRELRSEEGWPIVTRWSGDPRLPVGVYVLAADRQDEPHDRNIPELTRRAVLQRDGGRCRWSKCGWPAGFPDSDTRFLELHHIDHHVAGGTNDATNLVTLCNLHHDEVHRGRSLRIDPPPGSQAKSQPQGEHPG